jgi:hypothetical protein
VCRRRGLGWRVRRACARSHSANTQSAWRGVACGRRRQRHGDAENRSLHMSASEGDVAEIERQIAAGADPNALVGGRTPLHAAAGGGHVAAIAALLAAGARVDDMDPFRQTPLMFAALNGHSDAVAALLAAGADVHHSSSTAYTALHCASMWGHLDTARVLLQAGVRVDARAKNGGRPADVVSAPAASFVCLLRLRAHAIPLNCVVAVRRCAWAPRTRSARQPSVRCLRPQRPGPAAAPPPSPATQTRGSGRHRGSGGWRW